ncbi:HlyD family efflux transporter periplasmic adaptor subunit [uncultured Bacteroides sp.]|uniref:HlyD family efflux transporter periplasmic adaptor subunit n=1 Tax=uncultured Bacteroides sp. TaxID=162156 RepID=UPI002AA90543|nr:HlyD family efflux transporter periplasmic adaptor subunit [uncultured Bacteroides sp.]
MEEEEKNRDIELRSEEVQEVLNHISPWIVRWGITALFIILLIILVGCWAFKYPDTVAAEVTLATAEPPAFVLAHATGKLDILYVENGSEVKSGEALGVIGNAASSEDVFWLVARMDEWKKENYSWRKGIALFASKRLQLGELQSVFSVFITSLSEYVHFIELDYYAKKLRTQKKQLEGKRSYLDLAERESALFKKNMILAHNMYSRDSILYAHDAMIAAEFEESGSKYLQSLRSKENTNMNLLQAKIDLVQYEENLLDIHKQAYDEEQTRRTKLENVVEQLAAELSTWKHSYLLRSPVNGKVSFTTVWSRNQNVKLGETVFMIQPSDSSKVLGKALLPLQGSGKVHVGQLVHVRLNNYPDQEFGYIKGTVKNISPAPTEDGMYVVEIDLPDGLETNYGKLLPTSRELKGTTDIILADKSIIERLLEPLRNLVLR